MMKRNVRVKLERCIKAIATPIMLDIGAGYFNLAREQLSSILPRRPGSRNFKLNAVQGTVIIPIIRVYDGESRTQASPSRSAGGPESRGPGGLVTIGSRAPAARIQ